MKYDKVLQVYAKEWKEKFLSEDVLKLIAQATSDLYNGPVVEEGYPGFVSACVQIKEALHSLPSYIYIDTQSESVSEHEPQSQECHTCGGTGKNSAEDETCDTCDGTGKQAPVWEDFAEIDSVQIRIAILGKELASYI